VFVANEARRYHDVRFGPPEPKRALGSKNSKPDFFADLLAQHGSLLARKSDYRGAKRRCRSVHSPHHLAFDAYNQVLLWGLSHVYLHVYGVSRIFKGASSALPHLDNGPTTACVLRVDAAGDATMSVRLGSASA
jgi:hypothetical protein